MKYRVLGKSGIKVSEIGFGAWTLGLDWWGKKIEDDEAKKLLKHAYDLGINYFETGDIYGRGKSEQLIGEVFSGMRNEVVISTKYGYDIYSNEQIGHKELPQKFTPEFTEFALQKSLERLKTDYLDVYGLHNPKIHTIRDKKIFDYLDNKVKEGTVKSYQIALGPAIGWTKEGLEAMDLTNTTAVQTVYNILEQNPGNILVEQGEKHDVGILVRVPDASGILTGKVTMDTKISEKDHRSVRSGDWVKQSLEKVDQLMPIAKRYGWNITELAIKFILSHSGVSSVLPTVVSEEEVTMFSQMSDGKYLNPSDKKEITELFNQWPPYELKSSAQTA
ncbi:MAG: aldo/keto reductase [Thaumarchaeota archaeon]|nr:aldo/keto reductase [Nitrososphaerota archaeon]MDE1867201.1 aldo/keto reductase [Nitrososphaerota archaeon]